MTDTSLVYIPIIVVVGTLIYGCAIAYGKAQRYKTAAQKNLQNTGLTAFFFVAILGVYFFSGYLQESDQKRMLRDQFALSDDIELIDFKHRGLNNNGTNVITRSVFRFTDEQLQAYKNMIDNPAHWQPKLLSHAGNDLVATYAPNTIAWNSFPKRLTDAELEGKRIEDLPWLYDIWWTLADRNIKRGKIMCFLFQEADKTQRWTFGYYGTFLASPCSQVLRREKTSAYVMAILDYDKKTLSITVD